MLEFVHKKFTVPDTIKNFMVSGTVKMSNPVICCIKIHTCL